MTAEELVLLLDNWINDAGQWDDFIEDMQNDGYTEEEIMKVIEECKQ